MRIYLISLCLAFQASIIKAQVSGPEDRVLSTAVKEYQSLQSEINSYLKNKSSDCNATEGNVSGTSYCSLKEICSNPNIKQDNPFIYQNEKGEKIINENYYNLRNGIKACLKEKYADEISEKRYELAKKLEFEHLNKIIEANKKLKVLTKKYYQGAKIQKISSEVLTMSLESGLASEKSDWNKLNPSRIEINEFITKAEKRTNTTLRSEVKKTLVEIEFLKKDKLYSEQLDIFEEEILPSTEVKDPFYDWKLLTDEKSTGTVTMAANRLRFTQKTQDAYALFSETQKEMLDYLENKKNVSNKDKIDRIIERVKTIKFSPPNLTKTLSKLCRFPNAAYDSATHTFIICPQMLDYPKMELMATMAHEMAHSFDSCTFSGKFYKEKGPVVVEEAPFELEIQMTPVLGNYKNTRSEDPPRVPLRNRLQDKMLYTDNPFSETLSCLQDPRSIGAASIKLDEMRMLTHEKLAELTRIGQNTKTNIEAREINYFAEHEMEYYDYFKGCDSSDNNPLGGSQIHEAFADKISSEIMARKFKTMDKASAEETLLQMTLSWGHICANETIEETKIREFAVKEGCPEYSENMTNEARLLKNLSIIDPTFNNHPDTKNRIEKIFLAHPDIRKALNCSKESGVKYCE